MAALQDCCPGDYVGREARLEQAVVEVHACCSGWFNMKSSELNAETKRDLQLLKLRGAYDPKRFYKSSDHKRGFPAQFQMGTVVGAPTDFYSSRLTKREQQHRTLHRNSFMIKI